MGRLLVVGSVAFDTVSHSFRRSDGSVGWVGHVFFHGRQFFLPALI